MLKCNNAKKKKEKKKKNRRQGEGTCLPGSFNPWRGTTGNYHK